MTHGKNREMVWMSEVFIMKSVNIVLQVITSLSFVESSGSLVSRVRSLRVKIKEINETMLPITTTVTNIISKKTSTTKMFRMFHGIWKKKT